MQKYFVHWALHLLLAIGASAANGETVDVQSVLINVLEEANVPARQEGVLKSILVEEGQLVSESELLAQIDDQLAQLAVKQAETEMEIARKQTENVFVLRTAEQEHRVAANDLRRAIEAKAEFEKSISPADLDRYQLENDKTAVMIERSKFDLEIAKLTYSVRESELAKAANKLEQHGIVAPLSGMIVDVKRRRGEWVMPGEQVMRILRVDRLRADGFIRADDVQGTIKGSVVTLTVDLPGGVEERFRGEVIFVSPEISPVDRKVRIWAAIENRGLLLQPGMNAKMSIEMR